MVRGEHETRNRSIALVHGHSASVAFEGGILDPVGRRPDLHHTGRAQVHRPNMGVNRSAKIGFSHQAFTAPFVGTFEMVCGFLVLIGLVTRIAAVPLLIVICTAIATTKIPEFSRPNQGFWFMVSDARTDFTMLMSLSFLIVAGSGSWSFDSNLGGPIPAEKQKR
jgi:putative oxidoreductase